MKAAVVSFVAGALIFFSSALAESAGAGISPRWVPVGVGLNLTVPNGEEWGDQDLAEVSGECAPAAVAIYATPGVGEAAAVATVAVAGGYLVYKAGKYLYKQARNWYEARRAKNKSKKKGGGSADQNRAEYRAKGFPDNQLGPSGKPKRHWRFYSTRKRAKEKAKRYSWRKNDPKHHAHVYKKGVRRRNPHYHAVDRYGEPKKPNVHYEYPKSRQRGRPSPFKGEGEGR